MGIVIAVVMVCAVVASIASVLWAALPMRRLHRAHLTLSDGPIDRNVIAFGIGGSNFLHS